MPSCVELVRVRAEDLDAGRRVRVPKTKRLAVVVDVEALDWQRCAVTTEEGVIVCKRSRMFDAEDGGEA